MADGDVGAITRYRSRPEVTRFLTHEPSDREAVAERITQRLVGDNGSGQLVRGVVAEWNSEVLAKEMLGEP
jgi:hypothetical protein